MTTREYVAKNFRSNNERGLALLADLFEKEDWSVEALEKIVYDSKLELPAKVSVETPGVIVTSDWKINIEGSYTREDKDDIGLPVNRMYPSTISVYKKLNGLSQKKFYTHNGDVSSMVYKNYDRVLESRYWSHYIGWTIKFTDGMVFTIEVDDSKHDYNFDELTGEQVLACELAFLLISEQEAVTEKTYQFVCETLGITKPISRFFMSMDQRRDGEPIGLLKGKLLYIDGKMEEKATTAGDMTFLKFGHGLKKVYGRDESGKIWTVTYGTSGEIKVESDEEIIKDHMGEFLSWAETVFETF